MNSKKANPPCGISMTGKVRSRNEDSFLYTDEKDWPNQLAIVADGIGGNLHGEIASRLCCQYFYEIWEAEKAMFIENPSDMENFMRKTLDEVNSRIFQKNCQSDFLETPMGSTIVAAAIMPDDIVVIHAGDSRFYDFRANGKLACLTTDHTFLQKNREIMPENKNISFVKSELYNLITKSVGTGKTIADNDTKAPLISILKKRPDSRYMLCSDGLTHMVDDEKIIRILSSTANNRQAVNKLIAASYSAGAFDNISIVLY